MKKDQHLYRLAIAIFFLAGMLFGALIDAIIRDMIASSVREQLCAVMDCSNDGGCA